MKKILLLAALMTAALALTISCSDGNRTNGGYETDDDMPALANEADSLAYYLGMSMAENLRERIGTDSLLQTADYDPELFADGLRAVLAVPPHHPGFQHGAAHGGSLQSQIMIFRSVDYPVNVTMIVKGFDKGMKDDTTGVDACGQLDHLLTPVNNLIIRRKLREHLGE